MKPLILNVHFLMESFIRGIPKCEIHMHICGNTEPEMVFQIAERNGLLDKVPYKTAEDLRAAYNFKNLAEFLVIFRLGSSVIRTEQDLYDITFDYLKRAHKDNVTHCELYFSPRPMLLLGMSINDAMSGVTRAIDDGEALFGIKSTLILNCQRQEDVSSALDILHQIQPWKKYFCAGGLAGPEKPFPPRLHRSFFDECKKQGLKVTIHAGEEGPVEYIEEAIDICHADRIDHGTSAVTSTALMDRLSKEQIPLAMTPLSNVMLHAVNSLSEHPIKEFLDRGILVSVGSDDPAIFKSYVSDNYLALQKEFNLTEEDIIKLAKNSFISSFFPEEEKQKGIDAIDRYVQENVGSHVGKCE